MEQALEQVGERADRISQYACLFDQPEMVNTEIQRYDAVSAEQIRRVMAERAGADNRLVLTYVPAEGGDGDDDGEDGEDGELTGEDEP